MQFYWRQPKLTQNFDFPKTIINFVIENPSTPKCYLKMIKCCKTLFEANAILVIEKMIDETTICSRNVCQSGHDRCVTFDINQIPCKLWLTYTIILKAGIPNFASLFCQKIFRNATYSVLIEDKIVMFNDFKVLVSKACDTSLVEVKIIDEDGNDVHLEEIVESLSDTIKHFSYVFGNDSKTTASTMKKISKLEKFQHLQSFQLYCVPETVLIEDLSNMIKDHENISFQLDFHPGVSDGYMDQIDVLINTVIESEVPNRMIWYRGQDEEQKRIMKSRYLNEKLSDSETESDDEEMGDE